MEIILQVRRFSDTLYIITRYIFHIFSRAWTLANIYRIKISGLIMAVTRGRLSWWKCLANRGLRGVVAHRATAVSPVSLINPLNRTRICRVIEGNIMSALTMASQCGAQPELICPRVVAAFDDSSIYWKFRRCFVE